MKSPNRKLQIEQLEPRNLFSGTVGIDALVLYDKPAADLALAQGQTIQGIMEEVGTHINDVLVKSGLGEVELHIVGYQPVSITPASGSPMISDALSQLDANVINTFRDEVGADIVIGVTNSGVFSGGNCGAARSPRKNVPNHSEYPYMLARMECFNPNGEMADFDTTVTHEFGHLLGMEHESLTPEERAAALDPNGRAFLAAVRNSDGELESVGTLGISNPMGVDHQLGVFSDYPGVVTITLNNGDVVSIHKGSPTEKNVPVMKGMAPILAEYRSGIGDIDLSSIEFTTGSGVGQIGLGPLRSMKAESWKVVGSSDGISLGNGTLKLQNGVITGVPSKAGPMVVNVTAEDFNGVSHAGTVKLMFVSDPSLHPHQNPRNPLDVNDDGLVTPLDALYGINKLNAEGAAVIPPDAPTPPPFYDVSGDDEISALDVLQVINHLNANSPVGEGESPITFNATAVPDGGLHPAHITCTTDMVSTNAAKESSFSVNSVVSDTQQFASAVDQLLSVKEEDDETEFSGGEIGDELVPDPLLDDLIGKRV